MIISKELRRLMTYKSLEKFTRKLGAYQPTRDVFNPWRDYDKFYDISSEAPQIRVKQMEKFLYSRLPYARYLFIAEAIGYQGGKFTGIALTSERILLGNHDDVKPDDILHNAHWTRTSNPNSKQLKDLQKRFGFTEPTATIIWKEVLKNKISPLKIMTWNIFPFHPFDVSRGSLTNRTPTVSELEIGLYYTKILLKLFPGIAVVSIGKCSAKILSESGIRNTHVPHPANGGAGNFREAIKHILI